MASFFDPAPSSTAGKKKTSFFDETGSSGGLAAQQGALRSEGNKAKQQGIFDKVKGTVEDLGKGGSSVIMKALSLMDLPRAAVVSGLHEAGDAIGGGGDGASWHDFMTGLQNHVGVGNYVKTGNKWADRALGFVGDVALDPLTYATFGTAKAVESGVQLGSKQVARLALERADELGGQKIAESLANRVRKYGVNSLTRSEAEKLGVQMGVKMGVGRHTITVPFTDEMMRKLNGFGRANLADLMEKSKVAAKVEEKLSAHPVKAYLKRNVENGYLKSLLWEDAVRNANGLSRGSEQKFAHRLEQLFNKHSGVDSEEMLKVVESLKGDPTVLAKASPEVRAAAQDMSQWWADLRQEMISKGNRSVGNIEDYAPWQMSQKMRDYLGEQGVQLDSKAVRSGDAVPQTLRRKLNDPNAEWFGEKITGATQAERRASAEDIFRRHTGQNFDAFNTNVWDLARGSLNGASRFIRHNSLIDGLAQAGLDHVPVARAVADEASQRLGRKLESQAMKLLDEAHQIEQQMNESIVGATGKKWEADVNATIAEGAAKGGRAAERRAARAGATIEKLRDHLNDVDLEAQKLRAAADAAPANVDRSVLDKAEVKATQLQAKMDALQGERQGILSAQPTPAATTEAAPAAAAVAPDVKARATELFQRLQDVGAQDAKLQAALGRVEASDPMHSLILSKREALAQERASLMAEAQKLKEGAAPVVDAAPVTPKVQTPDTSKVDAKIARLQKQMDAHAKVIETERSKFDTAAAAVSGAAPERAQVDARLAELDAQMNAGIKKYTAAVVEEKQSLTQAKELFAAADAHRAAGEEALAQVADVEALMHKSLADMAANKVSAQLLIDDAGRLMSTTRLQSISEAARGLVDQGLVPFADGHFSEPWVAQAMADMSKLLEPQDLGKFVKTTDWVTARWKAYALLSPGFHLRNFMGGMFNNALYGVDRGSYLEYSRAWRALKQSGFDVAKLPADVRPAFQYMIDNGVLEMGARDLADIVPTEGLRRDGLLPQKLRHVDPTSLNNAALGLNRKAGEAVENHLRGTLFLDAWKKTGDLAHAEEMVVRYHFDYSDLAKWEKKYAKRIIPFYTWTRKNVPLQIEHMLTNPGKYTAYLHAKRNLEMGVPEDDIVPAYYASLLAIRSPWTSKKVGGMGTAGDRIYLTPDLPFRDLAETFDTNKLLSQMNPLAKIPLEVTAGKQFFSQIPFREGLRPMPAAFKPLLPFLVPLSGKFGLPKVEKAKDGWVMSEKDIYKIDNMLPALGRMRRMVPTERKYQDRVMTSWLSTLGGLSARTNTTSEKYGEIARRVQAVKRANGRAKDLAGG